MQCAAGLAQEIPRRSPFAPEAQHTAICLIGPVQDSNVAAGAHWAPNERPEGLLVPLQMPDVTKVQLQACALAGSCI